MVGQPLTHWVPSKGIVDRGGTPWVSRVLSVFRVDIKCSVWMSVFRVDPAPPPCTRSKRRTPDAMLWYSCDCVHVWASMSVCVKREINHASHSQHKTPRPMVEKSWTDLPPPHTHTHAHTQTTDSNPQIAQTHPWGYGILTITYRHICHFQSQ